MRSKAKTRAAEQWLGAKSLDTVRSEDVRQLLRLHLQRGTVPGAATWSRLTQRAVRTERR
jgi:hypothetical protein